MLKPYLIIGKIVSTHGVRGELRLNPWADTPQFAARFKTMYFDPDGQNKTTVLSARPHGNIVILKLENIDTIEQAQALRNKMLYIKREDALLPENTWFIEDLIGCKVRELDTQKIYGTITDVASTGANDVWTVRDERGIETLIPAIKSVVIKADPANGMIDIKALKGLFDETESVGKDED